MPLLFRFSHGSTRLEAPRIMSFELYSLMIARDPRGRSAPITASKNRNRAARSGQITAQCVKLQPGRLSATVAIDARFLRPPAARTEAPISISRSVREPYRSRCASELRSKPCSTGIRARRTGRVSHRTDRISFNRSLATPRASAARASRSISAKPRSSVRISSPVSSYHGARVVPMTTSPSNTPRGKRPANRTITLGTRRAPAISQTCSPACAAETPVEPIRVLTAFYWEHPQRGFLLRWRLELRQARVFGGDRAVGEPVISPASRAERILRIEIDRAFHTRRLARQIVRSTRLVSVQCFFPAPVRQFRDQRPRTLVPAKGSGGGASRDRSSSRPAV